MKPEIMRIGANSVPEKDREEKNSTRPILQGCNVFFFYLQENTSSSSNVK